MVKASSLYTTFVQCCNSCILASYAVASYHFTKLNVYEFFLDYCKHFDLFASSGQDAERAYEKHFDQMWKNRKCSGFQIIEKLHKDSQERSFAKSRAKFDVEFIPEKDTKRRLGEIENRLKKEEVLVSVAFKVSPQCVHSACVGSDTLDFYMIETRKGNYNNRIRRIKDIQSLGSVCDSLLMFAHPTSKKSSGGN